MKKNSPALRAAQEITHILKEKPELPGMDGKLQETLREIQVLDKSFEQRGGIFFRAGGNAFETAKRFTAIHVRQYRETGRPSLPALAVHHAALLGIDENSAAYKALIMVAVRAEMKAAVTPDYHSKFHYMDVAAMTANLLEKNNEMVRAGAPGAVPLTKQEQALTFIAAIGHDLDHDGHGNPPGDVFFNEQKSFHLMEPLLQEAGLPQADIGQIYTVLMTTSPNGPHAFLKAVAHAKRKGQPVDFAVIDPQNKFPELQVIARDAYLLQMAAIVSDSDLYASSGAGMDSSRKMSTLLTAEMRKAGIDIDLTTDGARKFFFDDIVGTEGYASYAGRAVAKESFEALRDENERRLKAVAKPPSRKP